MHFVGFGEVHWGDLVGGLELAEGEGEAFADAVVGDRQHVGAAEAEDEQHLDRPAADAADLGEVLDDGFVGHATDVGEGGDGAVDGLCGEVAEGEALVVARGRRRGVVRWGSRGAAVGWGARCRVERRGEGFEQAAVDGGGGFAVELLVDDGLDEGFERGLGAGDAHGEGAGAAMSLPSLGSAAVSSLRARAES